MSNVPNYNGSNMPGDLRPEHHLHNSSEALPGAAGTKNMADYSTYTDTDTNQPRTGRQQQQGMPGEYDNNMNEAQIPQGQTRSAQTEGFRNQTGGYTSTARSAQPPVPEKETGGYHATTGGHGGGHGGGFDTSDAHGAGTYGQSRPAQSVGFEDQRAGHPYTTTHQGLPPTTTHQGQPPTTMHQGQPPTTMHQGQPPTTTHQGQPTAFDNQKGGYPPTTHPPTTHPAQPAALDSQADGYPPAHGHGAGTDGREGLYEDRPLGVQPARKGGVAVGGREKADIPVGNAGLTDKLLGKTQKVMGKVMNKPDMEEEGKLRDAGGSAAVRGSARAPHD